MSLHENKDQKLKEFSRAKTISYKIVGCSSQSAAYPAENIKTADTNKPWISYDKNRVRELILELDTHVMVYAIKIDNRSTSCLEIGVALRNETNQFVIVQKACNIPHNKLLIWKAGYLPAKFVRVVCRRGASLNSVSIWGVPLSADIGRDVWNILVSNTMKNLFDPVLPSNVNIAIPNDTRGRMLGKTKFTFLHEIHTRDINEEKEYIL